jgi:hypothetical protein
MLPQEHHAAPGRPQRHSFDGGDVEPFVEQVHREENLQPGDPESASFL